MGKQANVQTCCCEAPSAAWPRSEGEKRRERGGGVLGCNKSRSDAWIAARRDTPAGAAEVAAAAAAELSAPLPKKDAPAESGFGVEPIAGRSTPSGSSSLMPSMRARLLGGSSRIGSGGGREGGENKPACKCILNVCGDIGSLLGHVFLFLGLEGGVRS